MPFGDFSTQFREFETFFETTRLWLFGKPFAGLKYDRDAMKEEFTAFQAPASGGELGMPPRRIERTLRREATDSNGKTTGGSFARIYSFAFEGHYYKLPRPFLFLVIGSGKALEEKDGGSLAFTTKQAGLEARDWRFASDLRVWAVDKKDLAVCLDVEIGNYEQLLLDTMVAFEEEMAARGSVAARGSAASRGSVSARGSVAARGSASFRGSVLGPHQER